MNNIQEQNTLKWVEAMLSGNYKHGKRVLINLSTGCHCALGVAVVTQGLPYEGGRVTFPNGFKAISVVSPSWFDQTFGLPRDQAVYSALNDHSKNYLGVCALLLNALPESIRRNKLQRKMKAQSYVMA